MDRLKVTDVGGFPVVLDDLAYLQDAYKEAFKGIGSFTDPALAAANGFIISGCERSVAASVVTIQAGYIYLQGEVYKVDQHTLAETADTELWQVVETNDAAGNKVFQDTVSHDTYKVRKAEVVSDASPPGDFMPAVADRFHTKVAQEAGLDQVVTAWIQDLFLASKLNAGAGTWSVASSSNFLTTYKVIGKTMIFNFRIQSSTLTVDTSTIDIGLPSGIVVKTGGRQMNSVGQWFNTNDTPNSDFCRIEVDPAGTRVFLSKQDSGNFLAAANIFIIIGQITFEID